MNRSFLIVGHSFLPSTGLRVLHVLTLGCGMLALTGLLVSASSAQDAEPGSEAVSTIDFETQIAPLFGKHCLSCHGPDDAKGDFRIDDREPTLDGYIEAEDPDSSHLFELITTDSDEQMPPADAGGPMSPAEIALVKAWIEQGAVWPEGVAIQPPSEEEQQVAEVETDQKKQDQDQAKSTWMLLWEICGLLHPVLIHFPLGLIVGGAVFAILGFRGESPMSDAAYYCLCLGAVGSVLAGVSGWSFGFHEGYGGWQGGAIDLGQTIERHRWGGVVLTVLAIFLAIGATYSRRNDPYGSGAIWKLCLVGLAGLAGYVGHQGGEMTHTGLHKELLDKAAIVSENLTGREEPQPEPKREQNGEEKPDVDNANPADGSGDQPSTSDADTTNADTSKADTTNSGDPAETSTDGNRSTTEQDT